MDPEVLKKIIDLGNDIATGRYYTVATAALLFYDYFLTLGDEIEYAWHGKKSWVFGIFLTVLADSISALVVLYCMNVILQPLKPPSFTHARYRCDRTAFLEAFAYIGPTFLAQVVLTLRIYAITSKNRIIASCFCMITISQFIGGLYLTVYAAMRGARPILPIPLPLFMVCVFVGPSGGLEVVGIAMSVGYDLLAFLVVVYLAVRSNANKVPISRLFKTIVRDATYYFLVIFTSHLTFMMFLLFAKPSMKMLPASGGIVFLPVMVTRLLLSLKKAVATQEHGWKLGEPTAHTTMRFAERRGGASTGDEIRLDTLVSTPEGTQSQE